MRLTRAEKAQLYIATAAAVHGAFAQSPTYRKKPQAAAHDAREHAEAAVIEARISNRSRKP